MEAMLFLSIYSQVGDGQHCIHLSKGVNCICEEKCVGASQC